MAAVMPGRLGQKSLKGRCHFADPLHSGMSGRERAGLNDLGLQRRKPGSSKKNISGECVVATAQELPFLSSVP